MSLLHSLVTVTCLVLALGIAPSASQAIDLTCFDYGLSGDCSSFITTFCTTVNTVNIKQEDAISRCFTHPNGFRCDLTAWHAVIDKTEPFDDTNCENVMKTATASCPMGGSGIIPSGGAFVFTIDPNNGTCGDSSAEPNE